MNKKIKMIFLIIIIVVAFVAVVFAYNTLKAKLSLNNLPDSGQTNSDKNTSTAPDFTMQDIDGNELKLSDLYGKPIVLNFWATWCGYCKIEMPAFDELAKQYGDDVQFVMLNLTNDGETVEQATEYIKSNGYTFDVYFDKNQEAYSTYGAYSIPVTYFIRSDGTIKYYNPGAIEKDLLQTAIDGLLEDDSK